MELIGSIVNQGSLQGQINDANGYLTGIISNAGLLGGQVVAERGLKGDTGDTGAAGQDGFSPEATVTKVGDTATITVTDKDGTTTAFVTDGADGRDGIDGQDGHSPVVTASKTDKTTTVYVDGSAIATIDDGADGVVQDVEVNGTSVLSGTVAEVTVPTKVSDLNNDSKFITSPNVPYLTCATAGATAEKTTTLVSGTFTEADLVAGAQVLVKFTNANDKASPTLSVNGTTAKSIMRYGTTAPSTSANSSWNAGSVVLFTYDGTYWQMDNYLNTTYSEISEANITNATGSSTGLATGRRVKKAVETFAPVTSVNGSTGAITTHDVPSGGTSGQVLAKTSNDDYDLTWTTPSAGSVTDVTQNGTSVLDGTVAKVITHDVPSGGTSGQVLAKDSNDDYDLAWITVSGGGDVVYATSSDSASTVAKTATIVKGTLTTLTSGVQAIVKFSDTNTASSPTLNIGGTGAKSIKRYGTTAVGQNQNESWVAGSPVLFVYDGTNWVIAGWLNTTYSGGTASGITTGTDNLNYIWSPKQIHDGITGLSSKVQIVRWT